MEMNENVPTEKFVRLTTGGTSVTRASKSQRIPFQKGNVSVEP